MKQDKAEKIDESLKEEEANGLVGNEAADGVEDKNKQKWDIFLFENNILEPFSQTFRIHNSTCLLRIRAKLWSHQFSPIILHP